MSNNGNKKNKKTSKTRKFQIENFIDIFLGMVSEFQENPQKLD